MAATRHFATVAVFFFLSFSSTLSSAETNGEQSRNAASCLVGWTCSGGSLDAGAWRTRILLAAQSDSLKTCGTARDQLPCDKPQAKQAVKTRPPETSAAKSATRTALGDRPERSRHAGSTGCVSGHWIDSVSEDGAIIELEDGSVWEVDIVDAIDAALWIPTTEVVVCEGKLINIEDKETVSATRTE